jgi:uncharacterized protein YecE (DUF72 family)
MSALLVGCCGWAGARSRYFEDFPVVEIQTTFYQPPSAALAEKWRAEAPGDFLFTLKAWQLISHPASSPTYRRLRQPVPPEQRDRYGFFRPTDEVWEAWSTTRAIARALRAAVVVFQCPASFTPTAENCANLVGFFSRVDREGQLFAWEPRGNWPPDQVQALCRRLDLIHCVDPLAAQSTHGRPAYFRLHGRGGYNYRYSDADLDELADICGRHPEGYVMFNNVHMRDDARRFRDSLQ